MRWEDFIILIRDSAPVEPRTIRSRVKTRPEKTAHRGLLPGSFCLDGWRPDRDSTIRLFV
jgi:hypothetical protein